MARVVGVIRVPYERASVPMFTRPLLLNQGGFGQKGRDSNTSPFNMCGDVKPLYFSWYCGISVLSTSSKLWSYT